MSAATLPTSEPIDVVYTWVDDSWPGYLDTLDHYAETKHDINPNRTRDNLDVLKYSLRSLERFVPWVRNVYLFSMRPQVPEWLDVAHPRLRVVHHDAVMDESHLPTFNSFAILSHVHELPGLSDRFLYLSDDFLMGAPIDRADLLGDDDRDPVYLKAAASPPPSVMHSDRKSPWDAGRAYSNHLLDEAFGETLRRDPGHLIFAIRKSVWSEMMERWPEEFARLRASRFRARYNVVPEYLYPQYLVHTGRARVIEGAAFRRAVHYVAIENYDLKARFDTWWLPRRAPKFYALNDNFGQRPNPRVVARWRSRLETMLPEPCSFERAST